MKRDFDKWLSDFYITIADYKYYIDFVKAINFVSSIKDDLNTFNSLIGSKNIEEDFLKLIDLDKNLIKIIPMLIANRFKKIYCKDEKGLYLYNFDPDKANLDHEMTNEKLLYFMKETGIFSILEKGLISNFSDYIFGIEVGLDSNARKNRSGKLMENTIENFIKKAGFIKNENYFNQMSSDKIVEKWNINKSLIDIKKRFDFVVKTENMVYGIETNFYSSNRSKLNEIARSYMKLNSDSKNIDNFTFVWFTDGKGWDHSSASLKLAFESIEHIYNIKEIEEGIMSKIFK